LQVRPNSGHHTRTIAPRNFFGLRLTFADFAAFRFFVLADFFNTGMEGVCRKHRIIVLIGTGCKSFDMIAGKTAALLKQPYGSP